jgi:hypothetical protein
MPIEGWIQHCKVAGFLYDWQTLLAGVLAVLAAWRTIHATVVSASREVKASQEQTAVARDAVRLEQEGVAREIDTLRKSIAVELRLHVARALGAYDGLYGLGFMPNAPPITAGMVESKSRIASPIIYPANAGKVGLLGAEAMDVVIVYDLLEIARDGAARITKFRSPDDIDRIAVLAAANAFLDACAYARAFCRDCEPAIRRKTAETRP